jgi:hypothetical protein
MDSKVHDEPSSVASEEGQVIVDGPDAVAVTMTPEAAEETGHRLVAEAGHAAGYRRLKRQGDEETPESADQQGADLA